MNYIKLHFLIPGLVIFLGGCSFYSTIQTHISFSPRVCFGSNYLEVEYKPAISIPVSFQGIEKIHARLYRASDELAAQHHGEAMAACEGVIDETWPKNLPLIEEGEKNIYELPIVGLPVTQSDKKGLVSFTIPEPSVYFAVFSGDRIDSTGIFIKTVPHQIATNEYVFTDLKNGMRVGEWTVSAIKKAVEDPVKEMGADGDFILGPTNSAITFTGDVTLFGRVVFMQDNRICMRIIDNSAMPRMIDVNDPNQPFFCFTNQDAVKKEFSADEDGREVGISVDEYTDFNYPSEGFDTAHFQKIVEKKILPVNALIESCKPTAEFSNEDWYPQFINQLTQFSELPDGLSTIGSEACMLKYSETAPKIVVVLLKNTGTGHFFYRFNTLEGTLVEAYTSADFYFDPGAVPEKFGATKNGYIEFSATTTTPFGTARGRYYFEENRAVLAK